MTLIDISRTLQPETAVWPGLPPYSLETVLSRRNGASVNLTIIHMNAHTGTHVDAPRHFTDEGIPMEQVDLRPFWGMAQVVTVSKPSGPLTPSDLAGYDLSRAPRVLVRTAVAELPFDQFPETIVYPDPVLADFLGEQGIILYGTDAPSMDALDSKDLPGHHALRHNQISILEGLDLRLAPDGIYELVALPLKIIGGDGSPVRAILRQ